MIKAFCTIFVLCLLATFTSAQTRLATGRQPQVTTDDAGVIRVVYGNHEKIFYTESADQGYSFSTPLLLGEVAGMHLGMTRGPQLATSRDMSVVTAMDKSGNIHSFRMIHKKHTWRKIGNVNDHEGSAPEGLMSISADDRNNFYAVWLDAREEGRNNIFISNLTDADEWSGNRVIYKSPDGHVCECCKPSIAVMGKNVSVMFRNWLTGSRDLYLIASADRGKTFSNAVKLGLGTWPLKACPMDGGGLFFDDTHQLHTAWQRDGQVFYARPGEPEIKIGDGRSVGVAAGIVTWEAGSKMTVHKLSGEQYIAGEGTALKISTSKNEQSFAVWEKDGEVFFANFAGNGAVLKSH